MVSPEVDEGIKRNPESFNRKLKRGITTLGAYKEELFKDLEKQGVGHLIPFMSKRRLKELFKTYIKLKVPPSERKKIKERSERAKEAAKIEKPKVKRKGKKRKTSTHKRKGKKIKGSTSLVLSWSNGELRFLKSRLRSKSNKKLAEDLNEFFGTNRSVNSVRDRKLRLRGKKK